MQHISETIKTIMMELQVQKSLYNIRQDHMVLLGEVEEYGGELNPEVEAALSITKEEFQNKAISYGYVLKSFDDGIELIEKEIKRLQDLKKKATARQELIKNRLSEAMIEFEIDKLNTPTLNLSFRNSEAVEIVDEERIPIEFCDVKQVITISKTRLKEALKKGEEIPGAELRKNKNLQIK